MMILHNRKPSGWRHKQAGARSLKDHFKLRKVPEPERLARIRGRAELASVMGPL
jgi:hypothetical protein